MLILIQLELAKVKKHNRGENPALIRLRSLSAQSIAQGSDKDHGAEGDIIMVRRSQLRGQDSG